MNRKRTGKFFCRRPFGERERHGDAGPALAAAGEPAALRRRDDHPRARRAAARDGVLAVPESARAFDGPASPAASTRSSHRSRPCPSRRTSATGISISISTGVLIARRLARRRGHHRDYAQRVGASATAEGVAIGSLRHEAARPVAACGRRRCGLMTSRRRFLDSRTPAAQSTPPCGVNASGGWREAVEAPRRRSRAAQGRVRVRQRELRLLDLVAEFTTSAWRTSRRSRASPALPLRCVPKPT